MFFLFKVYNLFMSLFIHLLYLIWEKTICFNCLRGPYDCGVDAEKTFGCDIFYAHYKMIILLLYIN